MSVTPAVRELQPGTTAQLHASVKDVGGNLINGRAVSWSSDREEIATVSTSGMVTAVAPGVAVITATSDARSGTASIVVPGEVPPPLPPPTPNPALITSLTLDVDAFTIDEFDTRVITATPRNSAGDVVTGPISWWTTSDSGVVTVRTEGAMGGRIVPHRPGTVTITARVHGQTATAHVTVTADHPYDLAYVSGSFNGWQASEMHRIDLRDATPQPLRLLASAQAVGTPALSPDGRRVVFAIWNQNLLGLFVMNIDGTGYRQLTYGYDGWPAWSPDGSRIVFVRAVPAQRAELWTIGMDEPMPHLLLSEADVHVDLTHPTWSPVPIGGSYRIAYARWSNTGTRIFMMKPDGSERQAITADGVIDEQPAFSPDGTRIAFIRSAGILQADLWVVKVATREANRLAYPLAGRASAPSWSPDGKLVAFASEHDPYSLSTTVRQIFTVRADGSRMAQRTHGSTPKNIPLWITRE